MLQKNTYIYYAIILLLGIYLLKRIESTGSYKDLYLNIHNIFIYYS